MQIIEKILGNTSLWEVVALIIVVYLIFRPDIINRITKFKVGDFEFELSELKKDVKEGKEKISMLEEEIQHERKQFEELLAKFDADAPLEKLSSIRQTLKSQSRNMVDNEVFKQFLTMEATPEELYATAVSIREKRPVELFPDIIALLSQLAADRNLGGFRLNTIWTLTSAVHKILICCVRDGIKPFPSKEELAHAKHTLLELEKHPKVKADQPNDPMKGIRGPIKHSLAWIDKAMER